MSDKLLKMFDVAAKGRERNWGSDRTDRPVTFASTIVPPSFTKFQPRSADAMTDSCVSRARRRTARRDEPCSFAVRKAILPKSTSSSVDTRENVWIRSGYAIVDSEGGCEDDPGCPGHILPREGMARRSRSVLSIVAGIFNLANSRADIHPPFRYRRSLFERSDSFASIEKEAHKY